MARSRIIVTTLLCVALGFSAGCEREDWGPETLGRTPKGREQVVLNHGREAYKTYCIGCHGEAGDGAGPAARFLNPKPRDFRSGIIKFAAVESGELPHDADLERVIRSGLHGTAMSQWRFMPKNTVEAVVQYIKTFAAEAYQRDEPHAAIVPTLDPWIDGDMDEAREAGAAVYHALARCNNCHPSYMTRRQIYDLSKQKFGYGLGTFREDMYEGRVTESDWGQEIQAPDFLAATLRSGADVGSLYRVIVSGVGGTAMPTWRGALPEEQLWAMVHYIKSLVDLKGSPAAATLRKSLADQPAFSPPGSAAQEEES